MTQSTLTVLRVFVEDPSSPRYGLEVARSAGVKSGTLYPILDRLEGAGWLVGEWETIDPKVEGRPRRKTYRLTADGAQAADAALREAMQRIAPASWRPQLGHGAATT
jgi:DNA-binding PadR family transcriptional regulator